MYFVNLDKLLQTRVQFMKNGETSRDSIRGGDWVALDRQCTRVFMFRLE